MISLVSNEPRLNASEHILPQPGVPWVMLPSQRCCCGLQHNSFLLENCLHTLGYRLVAPESHPVAYDSFISLVHLLTNPTVHSDFILNTTERLPRSNSSSKDEACSFFVFLHGGYSQDSDSRFQERRPETILSDDTSLE